MSNITRACYREKTEATITLADGTAATLLTTPTHKTNVGSCRFVRCSDCRQGAWIDVYAPRGHVWACQCGSIEPTRR